MNLTVCNEATCVIEAESVRARRHSNALETALRSDRSSVLHEVTANSMPHPVRINEKVLQIKDAVYKDSGGETHDVISRFGGDSGQPLRRCPLLLSVAMRKSPQVAIKKSPLVAK